MRLAGGSGGVGFAAVIGGTHARQPIADGDDKSGVRCLGAVAANWTRECTAGPFEKTENRDQNGFVRACIDER